MGKTISILVIDDEPALRAGMERILSKAGYYVTTAGTGHEGLEKFHQFSPDIILSDVNLPDISGVEICRQIKEQNERKAPFITLISSHETASGKQAVGLEAGADGYIARPISNRELVARVNVMARLHEAETKLEAQKERLDVALLSAADGIIITDEDGTITFMNLTAANISRWEAEDVVGKKVQYIFRIFDIATIEHLENPAIKVLETSETHYIDKPVFLLRYDGKNTPITTSAAPIKNSAGKIAGAIVLFQDYRRQAQKEDESREYQEGLEKIVERKNREIKVVMESMTDREVRMSELKTVIKKLRTQLEKEGLSPDANDPLLER